MATATCKNDNILDIFGLSKYISNINFTRFFLPFFFTTTTIIIITISALQRWKYSEVKLLTYGHTDSLE